MINTCRKVPLQINLFRLRHFALVSTVYIVNKSMTVAESACWDLANKLKTFNLGIEEKLHVFFITYQQIIY